MKTTKAAVFLPAIKSFYHLCGYTGPVDDNDDMVIAFDNQEIMGVMRLVFERGVFVLRGMNIREDYQRRGIGTQMLAEFDKLITNKNAEIIYCLCGAHLESYYGQLQFKKVDQLNSVPQFLVDRMLGYQAKYGPQLVLRRDGSDRHLFGQPAISTTRLILEPIVEGHASEMWKLFSDPELHHFVPYEPLTLERQRERCARWAKRISPDGKERWLNWAGRHKDTKEVIAHFQVGIRDEQKDVASIGYLVARAFQRKGYAQEGLEAVFLYLRNKLGIREVKAWSDTRNISSHRLAQQLGMVQVEMIKDADFFKGATSDEFVFAKLLRD
jgi:RimJ/RimL family protein N-acetyltransferase